MTHGPIVGHADVLYANPTGRFVRACRAICVDFTKRTHQPQALRTAAGSAAPQLEVA